MHVDTWQNQYNIVKLKNKIKFFKKGKKIGKQGPIAQGTMFNILELPVMEKNLKKNR